MPRAPNEPADIQVVFAASISAASEVTRPALVIVRDPNDWNDYGLQLFAFLYVALEGERPRRTSISLMFEDEGDTHDFLENLHEERGRIVEAREVERSFVTLQKEATSYRDLVADLGFDRAIVGLRALHDVVLARLEGEDTETIELAKTNDFHTGMVRNSSQFTSLRRGGQYLRRLPAPDVADAAANFRVKARIPSTERPLRVRFDFEPDPIFKDRCCVLIGENGLGKTQLLNSIISALRDPQQRGTPSLRPVPAIRRALIYSSVPSDPYPRSLPPWDGLDYSYHPIIADEAPLGRAFLEALLDCLRDDGSQFGGARRDREGLLSEQLEQLGIWDELRLPIKEEIGDEFLIVERIADRPYIPVSRSLNEYRKNLLYPAIDWRYPAIVLSDDGRPRNLSSGELAMANFFAQTVASIETGSLLLFDEPETHLHPRFVSNFMALLQDLLERTRSIAIIATHSCYIVREVPRQRVSIFRRVIERDADPDDVDEQNTENVVEVLGPQMQTFGANVDDISRFVFGDGLISHRYERVISSWAEETGRELGLERVIERYSDKLNAETLSLIARVIRRTEA